MGKIQWDSGIKDEGEKVEEEIGEIIKGKNEEKEIESLQRFPVRQKVMKKVYEDCNNLVIEDSKESIDQRRKGYIIQYEEIIGKDNVKDNVIAKIALGKKGATKKSKGGYGFDYDYDASTWSTYIYCRTVFKDEETKIMKQHKSPYCRVICCKNGTFRGDTMNSWSRTLNEFIRLMGDDYIKDYNGRNIPKGYKSWEEFLSEKDNYKEDKDFPQYITEFMKVVYTIGNFIAVPKGPKNFNTERSDSDFIFDYWDLTLLAIYEYYIYGASIAKVWLGVWSSWFNSYGIGQVGWDNFVEKNYMQPFVNKIENVQGAKYGMPYELWDRHFGGSGVMPKEEWQFEQFFVNAKIRILERGKLIAKDLYKELSEESKSQK